MSGKLIMKRKLDKHQTQSLSQPLVDTEAAQDIPIPSESTRGSGYKNTIPNNDDESSNESRVSSSNSCAEQPQRKRLRCDTPPPEPEYDSRRQHHLPHLVAEANQDNFVNSQRNRHLLEAIQSKMLELQQELDEFEQDFETYEEDYDNSPPPAQQHIMSEQEAESLGYAMCARETILFLQREGIPSDSLLYTRLRDALVGRSDNDHIFHI